MNDLIKWILCVLLFVSFSTISSEQRNEQLSEKQMADIDVLLSEGKINEVLVLLRALAEKQKSPVAMMLLATLYSNGKGVEKNIDKACYWYEQAATLNSPAGLHQHAQCKLMRSTTAQKQLNTIPLFKKAAQLGHHISYCDMADIYLAVGKHILTTQEAILLCEKSAMMGSIPAMVRTAHMYLQALKNYQTAGHWFLQAAQFDNPEAQYYLAEIYEKGMSTEANIGNALFWYEKSASLGYLPAYYATAQIYLNAPKDPSSGKWQENALAKAYLWLSALYQRETNLENRNGVSIQLQHVTDEMPESWRAVLDKRVNLHLAKIQASVIDPSG